MSINAFEFEEADRILELAASREEHCTTKKREKEIGIAAIYVNDNFGKWQSDFKKALAHFMKSRF